MTELLKETQLRSVSKCEGPIRDEETIDQIRKAKSAKATGSDPLPIEYFKSHAHEIVPFLTRYYNDIHEQGFLPEKFRDGIIALIY
jgi:F420-0:gamma-glutamyl ligase